MSLYYREQCERKVCLDTETTGKNDDGTPGDHRIIEIGCVEIIQRRITGRTMQLYINPERKVDEEAFSVHHISDEFLKDKPKFADIYQQFYDFVAGAELIIHNAKFDVGFLNHELNILHRNIQIENICKITDTLAIARALYPGQRISLDALCAKLNVDESSRTTHGALLDAQILAEVYLAMTGGQESLFNDGNRFGFGEEARRDFSSIRTRVIKPAEFEMADHLRYLYKMNQAKGIDSIGFGNEYLIPPQEIPQKDGKVKTAVTDEMIEEALKAALAREFPESPDLYDRYVKFSKERDEEMSKIRQARLDAKRQELEETKKREDALAAKAAGQSK